MMIRSLIIAVLLVGVVATGYWGYTEHRDKNAILIHAENNYQQSFHELNFYMDKLQDKMGTTLALNSKRSAGSELAEVWQLSTLAHDQVGQLPLSLVPFNKTEEFLANVGKFSYRTGIKNQNQAKLSQQDYQTLQNLYKQATEVESQLRKVQTIALNNNLKWMDVEMALATHKQPQDNQIVDGLKVVDKTVDGFDKSFGNEVNQMNAFQQSRYKNISGAAISKAQAKRKAKQFLNLNQLTKTDVELTGKGANYPTYIVTFEGPKSNESTTVSVTKNGGRIAWFLKSRTIDKNKLSLNSASKKAADYLTQKGFPSMTLVHSDQYDNVGVFTFVQTKNQTRLYPKKVTMKVALDNGEVLGFNDEDYLLNHNLNVNLQPKLSKKQLQKYINKNLNVQETYLAVIQNDLGDNVLCYEVLGTLHNDTYQLFINANNGNEEQVNKLNNDISGFTS